MVIILSVKVDTEQMLMISMDFQAFLNDLTFHLEENSNEKNFFIPNGNYVYKDIIYDFFLSYLYLYY